MTDEQRAQMLKQYADSLENINLEPGDTYIHFPIGHRDIKELAAALRLAAQSASPAELTETGATAPVETVRHGADCDKGLPRHDCRG